MSLRLRGEYWITESETVFADGDVGDSNHQLYALEAAIRQISDHFSLDDEEIEAEGLNEVLTQYLNEELPDWKDRFCAPWHAAQWLILENGSGPSSLTLRTACEVVDDARTVAIQEWNWISVQKNQIVTRELTPENAKRIYDAIGEVFFDDENIELTDETEQDVDLNIFITSTQKETCLTLAELKAVSLPRPEDPMLEAAGRIATNTVATIDKDNLHPAYKRNLGD